VARHKGQNTMLMQRDLIRLNGSSDQAVGPVILIRFYVGLIFVVEGVLKYMRPDQLGTGRFAKVGIPLPALLANLDGAFEIGCGILIMVGLFTQLAVLPMIVDMVGALTTTKVPLLWGDAALYPGEHGPWDFLHEGRLEIAMLCGSLYLLAVGAGGRSLDARLRRSA
jgi:putative oxidoreductase